MTIQEKNISSFLIGLKELCIEHNLIISGEWLHLEKLPIDYDKRFFVVSTEGKVLGFCTQDELDLFKSSILAKELIFVDGKL